MVPGRLQPVDDFCALPVLNALSFFCALMLMVRTQERHLVCFILSLRFSSERPYPAWSDLRRLDEKNLISFLAVCRCC